MVRRVSSNVLLRVSKAKKQRLDAIRFGETLITSTGYSAAELINKATMDRVQLGRAFLRRALALLSGDQPDYRLAVSRLYYSMYHLFRAVVFYETGGDDHQSHLDLPKHVPSSFPDAKEWENRLKTARFNRNRADYDPYPRNNSAFAATAAELAKQAKELERTATVYLKAKGCSS